MSSSDKYTDPELRDQVKEEMHQGDKGGAPGQWSARKAQMMASEYKKQGGEYTTDKDHKDQRQQHLDNWTAEEWQTKEGSGTAKQDDGTEKRYLPKEAWESMTEKEKEDTEEKKLEGSREGQQYVSNTSAATEARKDASKGDTKTDGREATECGTHWEDNVEQAAQEYQEFKRDSGNEMSEEELGDTGAKKRGRGANQSRPNKKKREDPKGVAGDKSRVPQNGQKVQYHTIQGYVDGEVVEVVYEPKTVEGKWVKGSKEDPRVVLKSASSGKIAVHKPQAVYFD